MSEEYHDDAIHMIVDCKTGNTNIDKAVEMTVKGYTHLVAYCIQTDKFGRLLSKIEDIMREFQKEEGK